MFFHFHYKNENSEQSSSENDAESDSEQIPVYHKLLATLKTSVCSDNEDEGDESEDSSQEDTEVDSDELGDEKEMENDDNEIKMPHQESGNLVCFVLLYMLVSKGFQMDAQEHFLFLNIYFCKGINHPRRGRSMCSKRKMKYCKKQEISGFACS